MLSGGPELLRHCCQQFIPIVWVIVLKTTNTKLISVWLLLLSNLCSLTAITNIKSVIQTKRLEHREICGIFNNCYWPRIPERFCEECQFRNTARSHASHGCHFGFDLHRLIWLAVLPLCEKGWTMFCGNILRFTSGNVLFIADTSVTEIAENCMRTH